MTLKLYKATRNPEYEIIEGEKELVIESFLPAFRDNVKSQSPEIYVELPSQNNVNQKKPSVKI